MEKKNKSSLKKATPPHYAPPYHIPPIHREIASNFDLKCLCSFMGWFHSSYHRTTNTTPQETYQRAIHIMDF